MTRLLKYMRDHKGNFTAPSVLLTTLIGNTVDGTGEFGSVPDALHTVMSRIDAFLQAHPRMPAIANPALPSEDHNASVKKWRAVFGDDFGSLRSATVAAREVRPQRPWAR